MRRPPPLRHRRGLLPVLQVLLLALALPCGAVADRDSKRRQKVAVVSALQVHAEDRAEGRDEGSVHSHRGEGSGEADHDHEFGHRHRSGHSSIHSSGHGGYRSAREAQWEMHRAMAKEAEEQEGDRRTEYWWPPSWMWGSSSSDKGVEAKVADAGKGAEAPPMNVRVQGASGPVASIINGEYVATATRYNDKPLFRHADNPNVWLRYVTAGGLKQWRISTTKSLNANNDKGYIYNEEPGLDHPARAKKWFVWMGTRWSEQAAVIVSAFKRKEVVPKPSDGEGSFFAPLKKWATEHRYTSLCLLVLAWILVFFYLGRSWKEAVKK